MEPPQEESQPIVHTEDPYAYNSVAFKRGVKDIQLTQSANQLIADPLYNAVGKAFGIDMAHEWNQYYDKVYAIVEWAKLRSGEKDAIGITKALKKLHNESPSLAGRHIDNLYIMAKLQMEDNEHKP